MSEKLVSGILRPEMAAPILWAPRISVFFLQEDIHVHKIPRIRGGRDFGFGGGGGADSIFMGAGILLSIPNAHAYHSPLCLMHVPSCKLLNSNRESHS